MRVPLDFEVAEDESIMLEVSMTAGEQLRNFRFGHNWETQTGASYYASDTRGELPPWDLATLDNQVIPGETFAPNSWFVSLMPPYWRFE